MIILILLLLIIPPMSGYIDIRMNRFELVIWPPVTVLLDLIIVLSGHV